MAGFLLILIHALMSFMQFLSPYYEKFYSPDGTLTGMAGLSMLAGVLGFVFLWTYNLSFQTRLSENAAFFMGDAWQFPGRAVISRLLTHLPLCELCRYKQGGRIGRLDRIHSGGA